MGEKVFVAFEQELGQLDSFLDKTLAGQGQICFITGEAGAGKTALVAEFTGRVLAQYNDLVVANGVCDAQTGMGDPYLPFREVLNLLTGDVDLKRDQGVISQDNARRLRELFIISGEALVEFGPDLIGLLVPGSALLAKVGKYFVQQAEWADKLRKRLDRQPAHGIQDGEGVDQGRIFEQYINVLRALSQHVPLMLVLDDLQWADVASVGLLFRLGRRLADSRILVIGTYRPNDVALGRRSNSTGEGERHPLEPVLAELKRYYGDIWVDLDQARADRGREFVNAIMDTQPNRLDDSFRQALFRHTSGNPLFTVELLRDMQESGDLAQDADGRWVKGPELEWDNLPTRIQGVIEERIQRLAAELRESLTVASVEGEQFTAEVGARVQATNARDLVRRLSGALDKKHQLVATQGLQRLGQQRLSRYRFRHNLFQKYLYENLDEVERSYLHEDVGNALEELYGDQADVIAVQLARHFKEAGVAEKAIDYLLQAGREAVRLSANEEAVAHISEGLVLVESLPDTPERAQRELLLQATLGPALIATKGWGAQEVELAYGRARELCQKVGETPQLFSVLRGLWAVFSARAEHQAAREMGEQLLSLARSTNDSGLRIVAHNSLGATLLNLGELSLSRKHLEKGQALYDPEQHRSLAFIYGEDLGVACLFHLARVLWYLGYPDQALKRAHEALDLAQELSHPHSLTMAQYYIATLHQLRQEAKAVLERVKVVSILSTKEGLPLWKAAAAVFHGWALAEQGDAEEGLALLRQGLDAWQGMGTEVYRPYFEALLAQTYGKVEQIQEGLSVLDNAIDAVSRNGEALHEAELYRLKGELLFRQDGATDAVATYFEKAVAIARKQEAKAWQLRATVSLCRLWGQQGKDADGKQVLAELFAWFTEGFDTPDLFQAQKVLAKPIAPH